VILVTLGTHPQPMDRVVEAMDRLLESGALQDDVIVQSARFNVVPRLARSYCIVSFDQMNAWIASASAVVTHGGPGSIMAVLAAGKAPLVVPRDPALGEHVDGHQIRFVRWLAARRPIVPVWDLGTLGELLTTPPMLAPGIGFGPAPATLARIRQLIRS
jgi:UDP-N-acetylglucosamine transferase subunit ALG13